MYTVIGMVTLPPVSIRAKNVTVISDAVIATTATGASAWGQYRAAV